MGHQYRATIRWEHSEGDFRRGTYSRKHSWSFDGGLTVPASSSPQNVRVPYSSAEAVDPEEAFVASLSCCHMLSFLWVAHQRGFEVQRYVDEAVGIMTLSEHRKLWVSRVDLSPQIEWMGEKRPTPEELASMHDAAHHECFIANSVKTDVRVV